MIIRPLEGSAWKVTKRLRWRLSIRKLTNLRILIAKVDFPLPIKANIRLRRDEDKAKRTSATQETNTLPRLQGEGNIVKHSREI